MFNNKFHFIKQNYNTYGTILINQESINNPIGKKDFKKLKEYCKKVDKEFITIGDVGEKNHLLVGRFMTDIKKPLIVNNPYSKKVMKILNKTKLKTFIKKLLNIKNQYFIRRVQINQIDKGCFVGYHLDVESNPDYIAAGVIQFGNNFKGGLYRVYQSKKKFIDYKSTAGSLIISNCNYPHEVTKVMKGRRESLVFFVSKNNKLNKRKR